MKKRENSINFYFLEKVTFLLPLSSLFRLSCTSSSPCPSCPSSPPPTSRRNFVKRLSQSLINSFVEVSKRFYARLQMITFRSCMRERKKDRNSVCTFRKVKRCFSKSSKFDVFAEKTIDVVTYIHIDFSNLLETFLLQFSIADYCVSSRDVRSLRCTFMFMIFFNCER